MLTVAEGVTVDRLQRLQTLKGQKSHGQSCKHHQRGSAHPGDCQDAQRSTIDRQIPCLPFFFFAGYDHLHLRHIAL